MIASTVPATAFPQALLWRLGSVNDRNSRGSVMIAASAGTVVLAILAVLFVMALPEISWLVAVIVLADCATYLFLNLQQGLLNYRQVALFSIGRNMAKLLLLSLLWFGIPDYDWKYSHIVFIYLLSPLIVIAVLELLAPSSISFQTKIIEGTLIRELGAYGVPIAGSAVALAVLMRGDIVMLEYFHGEVVTGNYYAAKQLFLPVMLLPLTVRGLLVPAISGERLSKNDWWKLATIVLGIAAFVAAVVGLAGPLLIEAVYGSGFEVEQSMTLYICAAAWVLSARGIIEAVILGHGKSLRTLLANITAGVISLVIYLWFIPMNGASGAAQALFLTSVVALMVTTVAFVTMGKEGGASQLANSENRGY
jgi:O-antigen/teichoic acid export membrane protein